MPEPDAQLPRRGFWPDWASILLLILLAFAFRGVRWEEIFTEAGIAFADPDCWTRMMRVAWLAEHPLQPLRWHGFENYPIGIAPHTTAPLDYLILALSLPLRLFTGDALALAGALVSPVLGAGLLVFLWFWMGRWYPGRARTAALLFYAVFPPLAWAQNVGRPDHQSLVIAAVMAAVCLEVNVAAGAGRRLQLAAGGAWGVALWTSLYEPAVVFVIVAAVRLATLRLAFFTRRPWWWLALAVVCGIGWLVDGVRVAPPPPGYRHYLENWLGQVGEMRGLKPMSFTYWFGAWVWVAPVLVVVAWRVLKLRPGNLALFSALTVALSGLAMAQARWGALANGLACVLFLVPLLFRLPGRIWPWPVAFLLSLPVFLYHLNAAQVRRPDPENARLLEVARKIQPPGAILAPWWIGPALLRPDGAPIVASSSHQSIEGIVDASRFFAAGNWADCEAILRKRGVRWVVAADPGRTLSQAFRVLGVAPYDEEQVLRIKDFHKTMAARLHRAEGVPPVLRLRSVVYDFRIYEYLAARPAPSEPEGAP